MTSTGSSPTYTVPQDRAAEFFVGHYGPASAYFMADAADVARLEAELHAFLQNSRDPGARALAPKLAEYSRQFIGVVIDGERLVFANFFCSDDDAVTRPVIVDDGGDCYFNVFYAPTKRSFSRLQINGDA